MRARTDVDDQWRKYAVADLSTGSLADFKVVTPANFKGSIDDLKVFVRDTANNGAVANSEIVTTSVAISAVADGINTALLDDTPALNLIVGQESNLYDPSKPSESLFAKISPFDASEAYMAKLVFKATSSNALVIRVGGDFVLPQTVGADLVYSLTPEQLSGSSAITMTARSGLFGKSIELQAFTIDGAAISSVASKVITLNLSAQAVAPDASLSSASGAEDSAISVPVALTINPDRVGFEKIGFEITTTNSALQGGEFSVDSQSFTYSDGKWTVFNDSAQLDFSALTFTPPTNFSGSANFSFKSFSQTSSGRVDANATPVTVEVVAVAEVVQASDTPPAALTALEDTAGISFPLASYFETTTFTDADEKVSLEISLPSEVSLQKLAGTTYSNLIPVSNASGVSTYSITVDQISFANQLEGYRLVPSKDYASPTASGSAITIKAIAYETSNGAQSAALTQTVNLTITPVADTPGALLLARAATTIDESQAANGSAGANPVWFQASDAVKLSATTSSDASEAFSVEIVASSNLLLALRSGSAGSYSYTTQTPDNGSYVLSAEQYANLFVRGVDYASGAASLTVRSVHTESWGGSFAKSADSVASFNLKPVASGPASVPTLKQVTVLEDPSTANAPSLKDFITADATKLDATETLLYKVTIPTNAKLVVLTGSLPTATPGGSSGLSYLIEASKLSTFKVIPALNYSGDISVGFRAVTQESNGALAYGTLVSSTLTVTPVSDAPLLITPSAVSGLITNDGDSLAIPIQTALVDSSETLSVKVWVKGLTDPSVISFKYGTETTPITLAIGTLNNESVYFFEAKTDAELAKLATLNVSATTDFRLGNKLSLLVESSSKDTGVAAATVSKSIDLSIYRPIGAPTLDLNPTGNPGLPTGTDNIGAVEVGTKATIPFSVTLPANLPSNVSYDNVSILLTGAPGLGYFAVKNGSGSSASFTTVGASLGEGGVWLFRASDIIDSNGTSKSLVLISEALSETVVNNLGAQAFISDATGGTTAASGQDKYNVTFKVGGIDNTDPLILSLSGDPISSSAVNTTASNAISFELESLSDGLERPTYWVTGDAQALSGFAYLVKPGVTENQQIGLDSLYSDFNELAGTNRALAADGVITAAELSGVSLWFDKDSDAFIDAGELVSLNALPNFTVTVPEVLARAASTGEITPLYEAKASWTGAPSSGGALFAVAIPYKAAIDLAPVPFSVGNITVTKTDGATSNVTESNQIAFKSLAASESITVGGLTFTAGSGGATASQVATAFSGIANDTAATSLSAITAGGTFTAGTLNGWSAGNVNDSSVTFTSVTPNEDVSDLKVITSAFATKPTAKVTVLGDTLSASSTAVPEDLAGGIKFTVDLGKATLVGPGSVTHLIKVYGIPDDAKLSAGAKVEADGSKPSFWVLTEEQAANPLAIIGLPTNYLTPIALQAQAVASAVVGTSVQTVIGDAQAIASTATIIGVADTPLLTPSVSAIPGTEGGEVFVSATGQAAGNQTVTLTKGTNDDNETLYARVSLDTAATNLEGVRLDGETGSLTTLTNGQYEVLYSDLNRLAFDFQPFFNDPVKLTIEGVSKQGATSYAVATRTAEITISLTPVADTVSGVAFGCPKHWLCKRYRGRGRHPDLESCGYTSRRQRISPL